MTLQRTNKGDDMSLLIQKRNEIPRLNPKSNRLPANLSPLSVQSSLEALQNSNSPKRDRRREETLGVFLLQRGAKIRNTKFSSRFYTDSYDFEFQEMVGMFSFLVFASRKSPTGL
ncbi:unnamed protein product [Albugo candida]|uniref:Uncharacterized protein n=1 Tax=Albugo candida TaxID=65357 RepID=A0A024GPU0_9STRA|nr:unnamed protein product [Albugo candida]|eukprot:CCI48364.1 unnamed protein product [Albugo candida]